MSARYPGVSIPRRVHASRVMILHMILKKPPLKYTPAWATECGQQRLARHAIINLTFCLGQACVQVCVTRWQHLIARPLTMLVPCRPAGSMHAAVSYIVVPALSGRLSSLCRLPCSGFAMFWPCSQPLVHVHHQATAQNGGDVDTALVATDRPGLLRRLLPCLISKLSTSTSDDVQTACLIPGMLH
jgi:hypothetical protein